MAMNKTALKIACTNMKCLLFDCDGVMTDGRIVLGDNGIDLKFFSTKDGMGLNVWHRAGHLCGCITGRASAGLAKRAAELKFEELHQAVDNKRDVLHEIMKRRNLVAEQVAYIGDDLNDLALIGRVGMFFAPADAHEAVLERADIVLKTPGGRGCIREVVDLILRHQGALENIIASFLA